jgi:hypothetical protein
MRTGHPATISQGARAGQNLLRSGLMRRQPLENPRLTVLLEERDDAPV